MRKNLFLVFFLTFFFASNLPFADAILAPGVEAPRFREEDIEGRTQASWKYAGKPLVIYFWATWCPACRREAGPLDKVYKAYQPKGVHFISVSLDHDLEQLKRFIQAQGIHYPVLFDGKGWDNKMAELFDVRQTPSYLVIGTDGKIATVGNRAHQLDQFLSQNLNT